VSRRHDRRRRAARAARRAHEQLDLHPTPEPFDSARAFDRWRSILTTATCRGFTSPPFAGLVFGPVVHVDLHGNGPPDELREMTLAEVVRLTKQQPPS
jgi:hypothetical protein